MNRKGLGRGLGALIPTAPPQGSSPTSGVDSVASDARQRGGVPGDGMEQDGVRQERVQLEVTSPTSNHEEAPAVDIGASFAEIPVDDVIANPQQPRQVFDEEQLAELEHSIREIGVLQPIVVRPAAAGYELIMGERRLRASKRAGLLTIPAIVRETKDEDLLRDALLENLHRAQLNPLEEAAAYQQMLDDFGCTQEVLSERIGRSRPQIANTIRLLKLPPAVQRRVAANVLSAGHARALLALDDPEAQDSLASRVVAEGISVRQLEEIVRFGDADASRSARKLSTRPADPRAEEFAARLSDRLDTRVKVDIGKSKGKITVDFATVEDLRRIVDLVCQVPTQP